MRINKYIASSGMCSRRKAEEFINNQQVYINGQLATLSSTVEDSDKVIVNGKKIEPIAKEIYLLLNKPVGITCTTERHIDGNIIDFVNYPERIFPIGRLDKDSSGLILLTNQGDLVNKVLRSEEGHEKEYEVTVDRKISDEFIQNLSNGVKIYNPVTNSYVVTQPCVVHQTSTRSFTIVLQQGYNRQIRRMCSAFDYHVQALRRTRFLFLTIQDLAVGKYRNLNEQEIDLLLKQANIK